MLILKSGSTLRFSEVTVSESNRDYECWRHQIIKVSSRVLDRFRPRTDILDKVDLTRSFCIKNCNLKSTQALKQTFFVEFPEYLWCVYRNTYSSLIKSWACDLCTLLNPQTVTAGNGMFHSGWCAVSTLVIVYLDRWKFHSIPIINTADTIAVRTTRLQNTLSKKKTR
jgi:hypothetical protein